MHASRFAPRRAVAPLLIGLLLALFGCGGGGGGGGGPSTFTGPPGATLDASGGTGSTPPAGGGSTGTGDGPATGDGGASGDGNASGPPDSPSGREGDDTYVVTRGDEQIVEREGEGNDTVLTSVSFQLPANVENMRTTEPSSAAVLTGNDLPNHIVGSPFMEEDIYGLDSDDILDGGGRHGGFQDGGAGNDRLLTSFGELMGGPGADTFVAAGRGAHTSPETPIIVRDFNGAAGDRIEIYSSQAHSSAELFARGALRFDAATSTLTLDFDPSTTAPSSVDQVFILNGVTEFDPGWVTFTVPAS